MAYRYISLVAAVAALCAAAPQPQADLFTLEVRPVQEQGQYAALDVTLRFRGDQDGETELGLPNDWGGQVGLYRALRDLRVDNADLVAGANEWTPLLRHAPNAALSVRYRVVDDGSTGLGAGAGNDYRVRIAADHFFALGNAFVIQPAHLPENAPAQFDLVGLPAGASFASDLEHARYGRALTLGDVLESAMLGGNVRVVDAGGGARLAIHGAVESRDDAGWRDSFVRIAQAQRDYWGTDVGAYLVTILTEPPDQPGSISVGGTARTDAFAFFSSTNAPVETLDQVLAHEMMHTWTPRRIGALREQPAEQQDYWLSEGFTDWAMMRAMARSGAWTATDFARVLNGFVREYDLSPVREAPNARIIADFWNDPDVRDLPYRRGLLLAMHWDARVRAATSGRKDFDDILLWMQARAQREPGTPAVELLGRAMRRVARINIDEDLRRHVEQGEAPNIPEDFYASCGRLTWVEQPAFHRGFDIEATRAANNVITGTITDGPAWRAGLRDGMRLIGRPRGEIGNANVEISYEVEDSQGRRTLSWMPRGQGVERFRRLVLEPQAESASIQACVRRLGGL